MGPDELDPDLDALISSIFVAVADYGRLPPDRQDALLAADDRAVVDGAVAAFQRRVAQGKRAAALRGSRPPAGDAEVILAPDVAAARWSPAATLELSALLLPLTPVRIDGGADATATALQSLLSRFADRPAPAEAPRVSLAPALPSSSDPDPLASLVAGGDDAPAWTVLAVRPDDRPTAVVVLPDCGCVTVWSARALRDAGVALAAETGSLSGEAPVRFRLALATVGST